MRIKDTNTGARRINGQATSGRTIRDLVPSEDSTVAMPTVQVISAPATSGTDTVKDATFNWSTTATTLTTTSVVMTVPSGGYSTGPVSYSSSNTAVATIDASGNVTPVSSGTTIISVTIPGLNSRRVTLNVVQGGGQTTTTLVGFTAGSLGAHLVAQTGPPGGLIGSQMPPPNLPSLQPPPAPSGTLLNIFNPYNPYPIQTRNNSGSNAVWTGALDLTCIPQSGEGVLIAQDTVAFATHVGQAPPQITFLDNSSVRYTLNVTASVNLTNPSGNGADILIAQISPPAPPGITPAQLMPYNFRSYLPQPQYGYPLLFTNQDKTLLLGDFVELQTSAPFDLVEQQSTDLVRATWWYQIRGGDSGNPVFHVINGKLVLAMLWYNAMDPNRASGPIYADNIDQINNAIHTYNIHSQVTTVDLSGFHSY